LEDEKHHSPFFGICALKRFSRVSTRDLPLSRETFNASNGTVVKPNFRLIHSEIAKVADSKAIYLRKGKIELELLAGYCLGNLASLRTSRWPTCRLAGAFRNKPLKSGHFTDTDFSGVRHQSRKWGKAAY
jgi:hypothetical protein